MALFDKGRDLFLISRFEDSLAASDEIVRRFGASDKPALQIMTVMALIAKETAFRVLKRPDDALAACDEALLALSRFKDSLAAGNTVSRLTAVALVVKGTAFRALQRPDDALAAYGEVVRRFGTSRAPGLIRTVDLALGRGAYLKLERGQFKAAIETVNQLLDRCSAESREDRLQGHLTRATAALAEGDRSMCEQDIGTILEILPELDSLPWGFIETLVDFSVELGLERMRELIAGSRSATLLQPLVVALEQELGIESQVAREVEEVARDIRKNLARRRRRGYQPVANVGIAGIDTTALAIHTGVYGDGHDT